MEDGNQDFINQSRSEENLRETKKPDNSNKELEQR